MKKQNYTSPKAELLFKNNECPDWDVLYDSTDVPVDDWTESVK